MREISIELKNNVSQLKQRKNKEQNTKMNLYELIAAFLLGPLTQVFSWVSSIGIQI